MVDYTVSFALKIHAKTCISQSIYDSASQHFRNTHLQMTFSHLAPPLKIDTYQDAF